MSLDGKALPQSSAVLVCPFGTGRSQFHSQRTWTDPVVVLGDITDGKWCTYLTRRGKPELTFDDDTMTCLAVICERADVARWTGAVADAMRHPDRLPLQ